MRLLVFLLMVARAIAQSALPAAPLGLDAYMPIPEDNPLTAEKIALGRKLFFDKRLSRDQSIACASCHVAHHAFADSASVSKGVAGRHGTRNAPALINRGYGSSQFWDGRSPSLEQQVLKPIQDSSEMDMTLAEATARVGVSERAISDALASYIRTIRSGNSRIDQHLSRNAELSPEEKSGMRIFRIKGNCATCHVGPNFSDEKFHNTGVAWRNGKFADEGRFAVSRREEDRGAFRTPTLREIARTGPYMHDGSIATLEEVIEHYDKGGVPNPQLDPEIRPLHLTAQEKRDLLAFLRALSGDVTEGLESTKRNGP